MRKIIMVTNSIIKNKFYEEYEDSFKELSKYILNKITKPIHDSINLEKLINKYHTIEQEYNVISNKRHVNTILRPVLSITGKLIYSAIKNNKHVKEVVTNNLNEFIGKHNDKEFDDVMNVDSYVTEYIKRILFPNEEYALYFNKYCNKVRIDILLRLKTEDS